jgi:short-subunit dehydrogenase
MIPIFQDQVILVTGSSQGIGKSLAIHLGMRGAKIGINGRDREKLLKTHEELNSLGIDNLMLHGDVTDYSTCEELIKQLVAKYGKLDALVANASMMVESTIEEIKPEVFKKAIDSQILGAVYPVKASLSEIVRSGGYILLVSSLASFYGLPRFSAYSMGKAAHTRLAQSLRFEMAGSGIEIGVAYVCFTKNEAHKQMMLPDGSLSYLPKRPSRMQYKREKVAECLATMIRKRKKRKIISFYGKAYEISSRMFPFVLRTFVKRSLPI